MVAAISQTRDGFHKIELEVAVVYSDVAYGFVVEIQRLFGHGWLGLCAD